MLLSSLYIPRVNRSHMGHGDFMKKVFEHQGFAVVKSVEFFEHEIPNAAFGFAIVKIQFWIPGIVSKNFQQRLKDASKETRIVFSDPSYWIVLPYTEKQKQQSIVKIPPPPLRAAAAEHTNCLCGCGGGEIEIGKGERKGGGPEERGVTKGKESSLESMAGAIEKTREWVCI